MSNANTTTAAESVQIHAFERAGLGKAPFAVVGVEIKIGPIRVSETCTVGSPGQPMGCCNFCGQGIAECWLIRSADGKLFDVGCDCVRKTGDAGLRRAMAPAKRKLLHERSDARTERARHSITLASVRAGLSSMPSPNKCRAESFGESALNWAEWMLEHAGRAGKIKAARIVEAAANSGAAPRP